MLEATVVRHIAVAVGALRRCQETGNPWAETWEHQLAELEKLLPSGGGFDSGSRILHDQSTGERVVLATSYHHMNEAGMYDGWTGHQVIVKGSLQFGFELDITGRDRNQIKDYIAECFTEALSQPHEWAAEVA